MQKAIQVHNRIGHHRHRVSDLDIIKAASNIGVKHYLVKPVDADQLLKKMRDALETERPVLVKKHQMMEKLQIDENAYDQLLQHFAEQIRVVDKRIHAILTGKETGSKEPNLSQLNESAQQAGAERLSDALYELQLRQQVAHDEESLAEGYSVLLRELRLLKEYMPEYFEEEKDDAEEKQVVEEKPAGASADAPPQEPSEK